MLTKFITSLSLLFNIIPIIFTASAPSKNGTGNGLYNPFKYMHFDEHKIYLLWPAFIILFLFVKLGSEKEFNYCCLACYKNCSFSTNFKVVKKSVCRKACLTHRTSPGKLFPESAFLVTAGILPAVAVLLFDVHPDGTLSAHVFFNILLVPIIMSAGWMIDKMTFYQNLGTILWFAIIGTVLNAAILMPLLYYGSKSRWNLYSRLEMDLVDAGLYSILICAVDPVAVLSVFESMHIDKLVYNVVFGESLLNDGVAVVFYNSFKDMKSIQNLKFFESVGLVFLFFMYAFAISVVLAVIMATIISFISKLFFHHQSMQFVVVFTLNYLTYIVGDIIKGSGILSLFFCVILQRQYVQANLTYTSNRIITEVLTQLALLSEGIVFILMGLTAFSPTGISTNTDVPFTFYLIFVCYVSRYIVIYALGFIANFFRKEKLDYRKGLFIQSHGGLRGAIGFALSLFIDENYPYRFILQTSTFIMVFFSVFILGSTIKPLVNLCKVPLEKQLNRTIIMSLQEKVIDRTKAALKTIIGSSSLRFRWEKAYTNINNMYFKRWFMDTKAIERNVSHSSVIKLHRDQTITDAQHIADLYGTMMAKDIFESDKDVKLRMYKKAWNNYASQHSFTEIYGKMQAESESVHSIPDLFILEKHITRRDVDDQMFHHNMKEGTGIHFIKSDICKTNKRKRRKINPDIDGHRLVCFKAPRRIIDIKSKRKNEMSDDNLDKLRKRYNAPKTSKFVSFSQEESIEQQEMSPSQIIDDQVLFDISNDGDYARRTQAYSNTAYENDDQTDNVSVGTKTRQMSIYDPFMGDGTFDIGLLNQRPPWLSFSHEPTKKISKSTIQKTSGPGQATKPLNVNPSNNVQPTNNTDPNQEDFVQKF